MFFTKKEMDKIAAKNFWLWFSENEDWIIKTLKGNGSDVVFAIDEELKPIFPYWKKELEFRLGFNAGKGEFFFFYMGNKNLKRDGETLAKMMPQGLAERWTVILEK